MATSQSGKQQQRQPPPDADSVLTIYREKHSPREQVSDKIQRYKEGEVSEIVAETDKTLAEVQNMKAKRMLEEAKRGVYTNANSVIDRMFQGKTPEQVNEILEKMSPQALQNLLAIERSTDTPSSMAVAQQPQGKSEVDRLLDVIKIMKEMQPQQQQQIGIPQIIEIVKAVQGGSGQASPYEALTKAAEIYRPFLDSANRKDKEILDLKLKEIEASKPQDPIETIRYVKEVAKDLGLSNGQKGEIDLRLEEMRQEREVDMKRLDWEQKKYEMEADSDAQRWESITKILQGPVGQAIQGIGNAGADRVRGKTAKMPKPTQTQCPQCSSVIFVDSDAETAVCGKCGAILQKQGAPAPQPAPPPVAQPTRVEAQPQPQQAEEQEQTEGDEDGHNEQEGEEDEPPEPEQ